MIVENTIRKLEKLAGPECGRFIADNRAVFIEKRDSSICQKLAAAKASEKRGEVKIRNHAAVMAGKLYPHKEPPAGIATEFGLVEIQKRK